MAPNPKSKRPSKPAADPADLDPVEEFDPDTDTGPVDVEDDEDGEPGTRPHPDTIDPLTGEPRPVEETATDEFGRSMAPGVAR
jgi:hypothetical protein